MKKLSLFGVVLLAIGVLLFLLSFIQFKRSEEVFRVGTFRAMATTSRTVPELRYAGIACASAGAVLALLGFVQRR
jgi:uncharacterized protein YjeT (DUF2065 family)